MGEHVERPRYIHSFRQERSFKRRHVEASPCRSEVSALWSRLQWLTIGTHESIARFEAGLRSRGVGDHRDYLDNLTAGVGAALHLEAEILDWVRAHAERFHHYDAFVFVERAGRRLSMGPCSPGCDDPGQHHEANLV